MPSFVTSLTYESCLSSMLGSAFLRTSSPMSPSSRNTLWARPPLHNHTRRRRFTAGSPLSIASDNTSISFGLRADKQGGYGWKAGTDSGCECYCDTFYVRVYFKFVFIWNRKTMPVCILREGLLQILSW